MMKMDYRLMVYYVLASIAIACLSSCRDNQGSVVLTEFPKISDLAEQDYFPLSTATGAATLCVDENDFPVVSIAAQMLADDVTRVSGHGGSLKTCSSLEECGSGPAVVAGTIGHSRLIEQLIEERLVNVENIKGKWEVYVVATFKHPVSGQPMLVIAGSDRRGTAFGLTSLCRAIGVSPWYWWSDVTPRHKESLYVQAGIYEQPEPSVQYRGIFINDERFGGWAKWVEDTFDTETHQVGPKVYARVFELLLRLRANYLWPAMHPGTQAFNADPENARLADEYAIVMGTSHCEQMLRNNEGEWKAVNEQALREGRPAPLGDFNYITNRKTMQDYWEERVITNGQYENTYTLGLRGIHDYPMEGANTTQQRVALMQQAIDDQRDMLRRHIDRPLEEIPQVLCIYEEVLDAYHNGLQVPDDVTLLWSDDKQGYTRNLCNPDEMKRRGGAGIYYHLSYHGDPASWIWLSPLSPSFISTELTKAYTFGARKIWVFNVGDIKPAEKEISFAMDMAWDVERWSPIAAHNYIRAWASETFGEAYADEIASMQETYYRLMASGKDSHVWFVEYSEAEIQQRLVQYRDIAGRAERLSAQIPATLQDAYFELVLYPIKGAQMLNEYQLLSRLSQGHVTAGLAEKALAEGEQAVSLYEALNACTRRYNEELQDGKWRGFFNWRPYHWYYSDSIDVPVCTPEMLAAVQKSPAPRSLSVEKALSPEGETIICEREGETKLWIKALTPVRNFSKAPQDNVFCRVHCGKDGFEAAGTPINNVWHSPLIGPKWCEVGTLHLQQGVNRLLLTDVAPEARIEEIFVGFYPPLPSEPLLRIAASQFSDSKDVQSGHVSVIPQLGYRDGVVVLPFDTPSFDLDAAPYVEYQLDLPAEASGIEIRTLPTLHIYEGRDARYAVQLDDAPAETFSIHEGDFTSEWRLNVLRGYASRNINIPHTREGKHTLRVYLLDPGIVLQEILVHNQTTD